MSEHAILAGTGVDRPGIVDEISRFLCDSGAAIEDTHLANLRGAASFMMLVHGSSDALAAIRNGIADLSSSTQMSINLLPAKALADTAPARGFPYRLHSNGRDQTGVVQQLSHLLRALGVNIENLKINVTEASATRESGFALDLLLSVPRETPVNMLREYLAHLCGEIGISCELTAA